MYGADYVQALGHIELLIRAGSDLANQSIQTVRTKLI